MESPRPTCPECGSVIDPRRFVTLGDHDTTIPDFFQTSMFRRKTLEGIYCSSDCVLDAVDRGYPDDRGPYLLDDE